MLISMAAAICAMAIVEAQAFIAYHVPTGTVGNQHLTPGETSSMGNDFNVNQSIIVTSLGVFDSGGDGISGTLVARLFDRDTQASLASITFSGNTGTLIGGSRFIDLASPLTLNAGFHGIISVAYLGDQLEPNGNLREGPGNWTMDNGGGLISFVGEGHYSYAGTGDVYPNLSAAPSPAPNTFAAGTFSYVAVPEPSVLAMVGAGILASIRKIVRRK